MQTAEREELYRRVPPPGNPAPINENPTPVKDATSGAVELRERVMNLRNGLTGGASEIRPEYMNEWLCGMRREEEKEVKGHEIRGAYLCV